MRKRFPIFNRRGQGTVENLMMTAVIAAVLIPIVYKFALVPLIELFKGQKKGLVSFLAQDNKRTVPNEWFAGERLAQLKDPKNIEEPKEIKTDDINEPGEISPPKDINAPQDIKTKPIKAPKNIKEPKKINAPGSINPGGGGRGGGGGRAALGSGAQDPDFFGGGDKKEATSADGFQSGDGTVAKGDGPKGSSDEYSPKNRIGNRNQKDTALEKQKKTKQDDMSPDKRAKQNLVLSEARDEERSRASPFDWWLLIKVLIVGLIIFLVILIGLSNMKKR